MFAEVVATLGPMDVESFVREGFLRIDGAFDADAAAVVRRAILAAAGCTDAPESWTRPVVRLGMFDAPPFVRPANTPALRAAFDALVGPGRWLPCGSMGTFRVAFPSDAIADDAGWHVDPSFGYEHPDFLEWRVNFRSRGRALLMLFLFSDVGEDDAPTRLRLGSHVDVARSLRDAGEPGMTLRELVADDFGDSTERPIALATGTAGTVYLCHPFLVHSAAKTHGGSRPRVLAQPPLLPAEPLDPHRADPSPIERAIRLALS